MHRNDASSFVSEPASASESRLPSWGDLATKPESHSKRFWPVRTLANFLVICTVVMSMSIAGPLVEASSPVLRVAGRSTQRIWGFQIPEFFLLIAGLGVVSLLGLYLGQRETWLVRWIGGLTPVALTIAFSILFYLVDLLEQASATVDSFGILAGGTNVGPGVGLMVATGASTVGLYAWAGNKLWRFARWVKRRYF